MKKTIMLADAYPELVKEWHPTKNGYDTPYNTSLGKHKKVWWLLHYDDPNTGKHFDFEWDDYVYNRIKGRKCPFLSGKRVWPGYNDLETTHPRLAKEWHPTKNCKKPSEVTFGTHEKVWWLLSYDDPATGKHFDFEWEAKVCNRVHGKDCPYLSGLEVWPGYNDLETLYPQLVKEWHPTKNSKKPNEVTFGSGEIVWWYLPYDDPNTGKHFDFEWEAAVYSRTGNNPVGCPYLSGKAVWLGYNDLETLYPQLAKEWHPTKNNKKPSEVTVKCNEKVWWLLPYDDPNTGKHFDFEWQATIAHRTDGQGCPYLSSEAIWPGYNDLQTTNPELALQWHPTKNKKKPYEVTKFSNDKVWWKVVYVEPSGQERIYEWCASVASRSSGTDCPFLSSSKAERLVYSLLKKLKVEYVAEKKFEECRDKLPLPFDIYIENSKIIIELDGIQHFTNIFYDNYETITLPHDCIKNIFCKNNNIILLRIPYIYDPVKDKEFIEKLVMNFIEYKEIPQIILDFYRDNSESNYYELFAGR